MHVSPRLQVFIYTLVYAYYKQMQCIQTFIRTYMNLHYIQIVVSIEAIDMSQSVKAYSLLSSCSAEISVQIHQVHNVTSLLLISV